MATGTIARLNNGYGFITQEGSDKDLFFHVNELQGVAFDDLREGDKLSFEVGEGPKGPNAVNVKLVEEAPAEAAPAA
jgi:CspA family cold shock protein